MFASIISTLFILGLLDYGSIAHTIDCSQNKCDNESIMCLANSDCLIKCNQNSSCKHSQITGPINGSLTINCSAKQSCFNATFNASKSAHLSITGCTESESCFYLSLYCPIHKQEKHCFIQGNDNLGVGTKIYTMNAWNDIAINYTGTFNELHDGTMFCGDNYNISCEIAPNNWSCINNSNIYCDNNINQISVTIDLNDSSIDFTRYKQKNEVNGYIFVGVGVFALVAAYLLVYALKKHVQKQRERHAETSYKTNMSISDTDEHVRVDGRVQAVIVDCR